MQTLYIDRKGAEVEVQGQRLTVRIPGVEKPFGVPLKVLEFLVVSAPVQFSSTLLCQLTLAGITVVFLNPRKGDASCIAHGTLHNAADRRLLQYQLVSDVQVRFELSVSLVRQKLRGQRAMLMRALRRRPENRYILKNAIDRLTIFDSRIEQAESLDSLRGIEGAGAAIYFNAYKSVFAPRLEFNGRNRRPPRDPVNVVLSLTYTLAHAEAVRALIACGFDPQLGVYHFPSFGRESLACDMVEIYRPMLEHWVWRLFASEYLRLDHFTVDPSCVKPCILGKTGRGLYYSAYEARARRLRRLMRRTARHWLQVAREVNPYSDPVPTVNANGAGVEKLEWSNE